jgi:hypothetical protein
MKLTLKIGEDQELREQIMKIIRQALDGTARKEARDVLVEEAKRVLVNLNVAEIVKRALTESMRYYVTPPETGMRITWHDWVIATTKTAIDAYVRNIGETALNELISDYVRMHVHKIRIETLQADMNQHADKAIKDALRRALNP